MTVNPTINPNTFDWNGLVDKINTAAPAANVQGAKFDSSTGNVTFTVGKGDDTQKITIEVPELDSPGVIDEAEFASLVAKLGAGDLLGLTEGQIEELTKAYGELAATPLPKSTGNVLFDIYALMALMLECAQKQRDASREIRQAENQAIQNSILAQADQQRMAALTGLIAGVVVGVIQVALQGVALVKSTQGHIQQRQAIKDSGIGEVQRDFDLAKAEFKQRSAELTQLKEIDTAQRQYDTAKTKLDSTPVDSPDRAQAQAEFDTANKNLTGARETYQKMATDSTVPSGEQIGKGEVKVTRELLDMKEAEVADKASNLKVAKDNADTTQARLNTDGNFVEGRFQQDKWHNIGDMFGSVCGMLQGVVRSATDLMQAEVTEMSADQKMAEEERDQIKDLFMQAQDVVKAVLSLFNAVLQAESASMRDAIHA